MSPSALPLYDTNKLIYQPGSFLINVKKWGWFLASFSISFQIRVSEVRVGGAIHPLKVGLRTWLINSDPRGKFSHHYSRLRPTDCKREAKPGFGFLFWGWQRKKWPRLVVSLKSPHHCVPLNRARESE